jgi:dTDP-4-dehydrorhamnose reductase
MHTIKTVYELEDLMSKPSERLKKDLSALAGDVLILGLGGKMGPSLAKLAKRTLNELGKNNEVTGASRFSSSALPDEMAEWDIKTIKADLLDENDLQKLPQAENIIYMAGNKFGTKGHEHFTWAMNAYLPGRIAEKYKYSKIVVFSTGNVYPFTPVDQGGATEIISPEPIGEYGQSCLGRERVFEHFSIKHKTPVFIYRLNYAIDLRYGVLFEIASAVHEGLPIDLSMGYVNIIWQGDANEYALRALNHCQSPPKIMNITGIETVEVRWLAEEFAKRFNKKVIFKNEPHPTALLINASESYKVFGTPSVSIEKMIGWTADWIEIGGESLNKPTHFQERKGNF